MARHSARPLIVLALVLAALATLDHLGTRWLDGLQRRLSDALTRAAAPGWPPDPDIVIVDIDEASLARLQDHAGRWPWPRAVHGELLTGLRAQRPRAIVLDVMLVEPDVDRPDSDAAFREAVRGAAGVYLPTLRLNPAGDAQGVKLVDLAAPLGLVRTDRADPQARAQVLPPLVADETDWRTGAINFLEDADGVGRRHALSLDLYGWRLPSLPARVARDLGWALPSDDPFELQFRGGLNAFARVSYADLWEDFGRKRRLRPPDEFRDKIVLIGTTAPGLLDARLTPLSSVQPGVEILATALDNLKNQRWMTRPAGAWSLGATLLGLALLVAAFAAPLHAGRLALVLGGVSGAALASAWGALQARWLIPVVEPLAWGWALYLGGALMAYLRERRTREEAVALFGRFLNPEVVRQVVERGETVESLSGRTRTISVLFSDIRGFTTLSETTDPAAVVRLLNRYFERQVEVVFRHGGTLDKFIGDCIMAFWGAPLDQPDHASRATAAALEMQQVLLEFRAELLQEQGDAARAFDVGIGVHTGTAVVGFIGARRKLDYTVIGDTVNLASRIEGLTKEAGCRILVSEATRDAVRALQDTVGSRPGEARVGAPVGAARAGIDFLDRGAFPVKGRTQPVRLFEPLRR